MQKPLYDFSISKVMAVCISTCTSDSDIQAYIKIDRSEQILCTGQFQNRPCPPPGQTPGHLTFLKNFGQIPRYVARIDGQMPHPLELQRGSNPPPFRHVTHETNEYKQNRLHLETSSAKFSATTNFLFSLSSLRTLNKGIVHDITI